MGANKILTFKILFKDDEKHLKAIFKVDAKKMRVMEESL